MKLGYRIALVVVLLVISSVYLLPVVTTVPEWWPSVLPARGHCVWGSICKGGIHLILQVEGDKAVETAVNGTMEDLKRELTAAQISTQQARARRQADSRAAAGCEQELGVLGPPEESVSELGGRIRHPAAQAGDTVLGFEEREERRIREFAVDHIHRDGSETASISSASANR
jgi:preprotein translocase subunit SecD